MRRIVAFMRSVMAWACASVNARPPAAILAALICWRHCGVMVYSPVRGKRVDLHQDICRHRGHVDNHPLDGLGRLWLVASCAVRMEVMGEGHGRVWARWWGHWIADGDFRTRHQHHLAGVQPLSKKHDAANCMSGASLPPNSKSVPSMASRCTCSRKSDNFTGLSMPSICTVKSGNCC